MKPYLLIFAYVDKLLINPMFGPSGSFDRTYDHSENSERHGTSYPARSRVKPPGPNADRRRLCVNSPNGFVWSMNCDN